MPDPTPIDDLQRRLVDERHREIAVEHLLFKLMQHSERRDPGLLDTMLASLDHLGDRAHDETRDDEAVRAVARRMIEGARANE